MRNLLEIEQRILRNSAVKNGLNLTAISRVQRAVTNAKKQKFTKTLEMSKLVKDAFDWYTSDEGKSIFEEEGISWSNQEFFEKVFGWQKSFAYKVLKAGNLDDAIVERFNELCDNAESEGHQVKRSLEALLKFAKASERDDAEGGSEGDSEGGSEGDEPQVEVTVPTAFTMSFKASLFDESMRNVALRVDTEGTVTTSATDEEIKIAIEWLNQMLQNR